MNEAIVIIGTFLVGFVAGALVSYRLYSDALKRIADEFDFSQVKRRQHG